MTKKQNTVYVILSVLVGALGGVAGTAFSMGAERQSVKDQFVAQEVQMEAVKTSHEDHKATTQRELDRLANIMAAQITAIQTGLSALTETVTGLRTDVQVLNAIMERMERMEQNSARQKP